MASQGYIGQLVNYIKKNISKGYTTESLKWALVSQGYSKTEVLRAIDLANKELAEAAPKLVEKPLIQMERTPVADEESRVEFVDEKSKLKRFFRSIGELFRS